MASTASVVDPCSTRVFPKLASRSETCLEVETGGASALEEHCKDSDREVEGLAAAAGHTSKADDNHHSGRKTDT